MSQRRKAGNLPQLPKIRLLIPYLTLNRPWLFRKTASESSKAGEGEGQIPPPCVTSYFKADDHKIWWCHTISKALPGTNKTFDVMIMMFL